jgi:hypothetical protein
VAQELHLPKFKRWSDGSSFMRGTAKPRYKLTSLRVYQTRTSIYKCYFTIYTGPPQPFTGPLKPNLPSLTFSTFNNRDHRAPRPQKAVLAPRFCHSSLGTAPLYPPLQQRSCSFDYDISKSLAETTYRPTCFLLEVVGNSVAASPH